MPERSTSAQAVGGSESSVGSPVGTPANAGARNPTPKGGRRRGSVALNSRRRGSVSLSRTALHQAVGGGAERGAIAAARGSLRAALSTLASRRGGEDTDDESGGSLGSVVDGGQGLGGDGDGEGGGGAVDEGVASVFDSLSDLATALLDPPPNMPTAIFALTTGCVHLISDAIARGLWRRATPDLVADALGASAAVFVSLTGSGGAGGGPSGAAGAGSGRGSRDGASSPASSIASGHSSASRNTAVAPSAPAGIGRLGSQMGRRRGSGMLALRRGSGGGGSSSSLLSDHGADAGAHEAEAPAVPSREVSESAAALARPCAGIIAGAVQHLRDAEARSLAGSGGGSGGGDDRDGGSRSNLSSGGASAALSAPGHRAVAKAVEALRCIRLTARSVDAARGFLDPAGGVYPAVIDLVEVCASPLYLASCDPELMNLAGAACDAVSALAVSGGASAFAARGGGGGKAADDDHDDPDDHDDDHDDDDHDDDHNGNGGRRRRGCDPSAAARACFLASSAPTNLSAIARSAKRPLPALRALYYLSLAEGSAEDLVDCGALSATLPAMHAALSDERVQCVAMALIAGLCQTRSGQDVARMERGLSLVMWAMKHHPSVAAVQRLGAVALASIVADRSHESDGHENESASDGSGGSSGDEGDPAASGSGDGGGQEPASGASGASSGVVVLLGGAVRHAGSPERRDDPGQFGVRRRRRASSAARSVQGHAGDVDGSASRDALGREGGVKLLLTAIRAHGGVPQVVVECCSALTVSLSGTGGTQGNLARLLGSGGSEIVLHALKVWRGDPDVQASGLRCIATVTVSPAGAHIVAANHGSTIALEALANHPRARLVAQEALHCLANLTAHASSPIVQPGSSTTSAVVAASAASGAGSGAASSSTNNRSSSSKNSKNSDNNGNSNSNAAGAGTVAAATTTAAASSSGSTPRDVKAAALNAVADRGVAEAVIGAAAAHVEGEEVQVHAMRAICNVATAKGGAAMAVGLGALDVAVRALSDHAAESAEVSVYALWALGNLAMGGSHAGKDMLIEMGGCATALRSMHSHPRNARVQQAGCRVVASLAEDSRAHESAIAGGAFVVLLGAIEVHPDNEAIQELACVALCHLSATAPSAQLKLAETGGVRAVLSLVERHLNSPAVIEQTTWLMSNLALHDDNRELMYHAGCVQAALSVLKRHKLHSGVQVKGILALCNLTLHGENQVRVARHGGIPILLAGMRLHVAHRLVQEYGCRALSNLAVAAVNKPVIAASGGIEAILDAMRKHARTAAGRSIVSGSGGSAPVASVARGWAKLRRLVRHYRVQEYGCRCLCNLAIDPAVQDQIVSLGGIGVIANAMRILRDFRGVQEFGIVSLCNLMFRERNATLVVKGGGSAVVLDAMRTHTSDAVIQEYGARAITNASVTSDNIIRVVKDGGITALLETMYNHRRRASIVEQCLKAILNIAANTVSTHALLIENEAHLLVAEVVAIHATSPIIRKCAGRVLRVVLGSDGADTDVEVALSLNSDPARVVAAVAGKHVDPAAILVRTPDPSLTTRDLCPINATSAE